MKSKWLAKIKISPFKDYLHSELTQYIIQLSFSIIIGLLAGGAAIFFHWSLESVNSGIKKMATCGCWYYIFFPLAGAIFIAIINFIFPAYVKERGTISLVRVLQHKHGNIPVKQSLLHFVGSFISLGSGMPLGPEAPAAQLGSGIGSYFARLFRFRESDIKMYLVAGGGAAISAVFNAPIAGVFFGIEAILLSDLKNQALSPLIISAVVANIFSRSVSAVTPLFVIPQYLPLTNREYLYILPLAVVCALVALLFSRLKHFFFIFFHQRYKFNNPFLRLIPLSIILAGTLYLFPDMYGIGYDTINLILSGKLALTTGLAELLLKIALVALFINAGAYGGLFAPALIIGALSGYLLAGGINIMLAKTLLNPSVFALIGMGGMLAGINSLPLTAIMLVFELTNDYRLILPLMLVAIMTNLTVIYFNKKSIQQHELEAAGLNLDHPKMEISDISIKGIIKKNYQTVLNNAPLNEVIACILETENDFIFVVDGKNNTHGAIYLNDIKEILRSDIADPLFIADDLIREVSHVVSSANAVEALSAFHEAEVDVAAVYSHSDSSSLIGYIEKEDLIDLLEKSSGVQEMIYQTKFGGESNS